MSNTPSTAAEPQNEGETVVLNDVDDELDLSDVPMDENTHHHLDDDSDEFDSAIEDDQEYILEKLFKDVIENRGGDNDDDEDGAGEEPEEELDEEERLRLLMSHLDPIQMSRYEYYKRTGINKNAVKKLAYAVLNQSVSNNVAIIVSGVSKVFVGEIVEKARQVKVRYDKANLIIKLNEKKELNAELKKQIRLMKEAELKDEDAVDVASFRNKINTIKEEIRRLDLKNINENGPLLPEHIREAWRLYQIENNSVPGSQWRTQGERDGMMFR